MNKIIEKINEMQEEIRQEAFDNIKLLERLKKTLSEEINKNRNSKIYKYKEVK